MLFIAILFTKSQQNPEGSMFPDGFNPYETLGVDRRSTLNDVRKRFRKLSLELHPDKASDVEDKA